MWFALFLQLFLNCGVLCVTVFLRSIASYRSQIALFSAMAAVLAIIGLDRHIFSKDMTRYMMAMGWVVVAIIDIVWMLYFSSEKESPLLRFLGHEDEESVAESTGSVAGLRILEYVSQQDAKRVKKEGSRGSAKELEFPVRSPCSSFSSRSTGTRFPGMSDFPPVPVTSSSSIISATSSSPSTRVPPLRIPTRIPVSKTGKVSGGPVSPSWNTAFYDTLGSTGRCCSGNI
ncbi:hypothetical protein C8J56DRAFT_971393 [Mycena floridula]|nr:hypothetical protein C8J56DRAFT_971393 [Mycena floridula]